MTKWKKRVLSLGLAVVLVLTMIPMLAAAAFAAGEASSEVTVFLTVSRRGTIARAGNGDYMAQKRVTVTDLDEDGYLTVNDALLAGHKAWNSTSGYLAEEGEVTSLWGVIDNAAGYSFFINGIMADDIFTEIEDEDLLTASINSDDEDYNDWFISFRENRLEAENGEKINLLTEGYSVNSYAAAKAPVGGLEIGYYDEEGFYIDADTATDTDGAAVISFDEPGTYLVTASGRVPDYILDGEAGKWVSSPVIAPVCIVEVAAKHEVPAIPYEGSSLAVVRSTLTSLAALIPQEGTTCQIKGDQVLIHLVPRNKNLYTGLSFGSAEDKNLSADIAFNEDGTLDLALNKDEYCGYASPIVLFRTYGGEESAVKIQYYLAIPSEDKLPKALTLEDGMYTLPELKAGSSGLFNHFDADSRYLIVDGDEATIRFITDSSISKYTKIALGKSSELLTSNFQKTIGTTEISEGRRISEDPVKYLFDLTIPKSQAEDLLTNGEEADLYIVLWNNIGESPAYNPGWYKPVDDIYLSLGELGGKSEYKDLDITNNTSMFKAVAAGLNNEGGRKSLQITLSGDGYHALFKGTYDEAAANGAKTENWIHGVQNEEGKWEFTIPLEEDQSFVPVVSISNSYYESYLKGENSLERAFYPRTLVIDEENATLTTNDYSETKELTLTKNVFTPQLRKADLITAGGPNSNNYNGSLMLYMNGSSYNEAFVGTAAQARLASGTIHLGYGNTFEIQVKGVKEYGKPETAWNLANGEAFAVSFKSASTGSWMQRYILIDEKQETLIFDSAMPKPSDGKADYSDVDKAIASIPDDLSFAYTPESVEILTAAIENVVRELPNTEQAKVDAMAAELNNAIDGLVHLKMGWNFGGKWWTYADEHGHMAKGWVPDGGKWYFMDAISGIMHTGWLNDNGIWYYLLPSGAMATGWVNDNGVWYYMHASGAMATGWIKVNNVWYYLKGSGAMAANEWCSGYWLNANGSWTYQPIGTWKKDNVGWWFGDTSGWYARNTTQVINGEVFRFNASGYRIVE